MAPVASSPVEAVTAPLPSVAPVVIAEVAPVRPEPVLVEPKPVLARVPLLLDEILPTIVPYREVPLPVIAAPQAMWVEAEAPSSAVQLLEQDVAVEPLPDTFAVGGVEDLAMTEFERSLEIAEILDFDPVATVETYPISIELPAIVDTPHRLDWSEFAPAFAEEAEDEPEAVFARFIEALVVAARPETEDKPLPLFDQLIEFPASDQPIELLTSSVAAEAAPSPVVLEVAERLTILTPAEKEVAVPVVQRITEAVKEVHTLRAAGAPSEQIIAAEEKLVACVEELFEAIGMERDEEKMQQFIQALTGQEFMAVAIRFSPMELARMGTHEVKLYFREFFAMLAGLLAKLPTEQLLGMFALFRASPHTRPALALYA